MQEHELGPLTPKPRSGLYVHVPFCETKCGYCDFFSVALKGRNPAPLVSRLVRELNWRTTGIDGIRTVFVGGGTPTLLPMDLLEDLLKAIGQRVQVGELEEFTVEANPATVDDAKARLLVESSVTRVSMGVQSFHVAELVTLERLHTPDDIAPSVATLRRHGVRQLNLDLIFGIPGQSMDSWLESLRRAIELNPDHIACYGLTYEPATRLTALKNASKLTPCDEDLEAEMFLATIDALAAAGYEQYEISNYARPGCQSRHNLIYWRNEAYIGVGPSAAGCIPLESGISMQRGLRDGESHAEPATTLRRHKNIADIAGYVRMMDELGHAEVESEIIEGETLMLEMILMQLRLCEGLSFADFRRRTGQDPQVVLGESVSRMRDAGLLHVGPDRIALTRPGFLQANFVMAELAGALQVPTDCQCTSPIR